MGIETHSVYVDLNIDFVRTAGAPVAEGMSRMRKVAERMGTGSVVKDNQKPKLVLFAADRKVAIGPGDCCIIHSHEDGDTSPTIPFLDRVLPLRLVLIPDRSLSPY